MIPDYRLCDVCGAKCENKTFFIANDRHLDAAGSMDDFGENWDLCQNHMRKLIYKLMEKEDCSGIHDYDKGKSACEFLKSIRRKGC